jgi:cytochrome c-type biogenesis protein
MVAGVSLQRARRASPEVVVSDGADFGGARAGVVPRGVAVRAGLCFIAGFTAVFMALGVLVNRAGALLADQRIWLTRIGGVILVVLGLHLMRLLKLRGVDREARLGRLFSGRAGYIGAFVVGLAFAAGWSPCIGPVLAGILTMAASGGSMGEAAGLLAVYSAGLAVPFLLAAFALERFLRWSSRLRRSWLPMAERVSGAFLVVLGVLLATGAFSRLAALLG